ncbi:RNA-binding protein 34 [Tanacetum coccineum]|uniref:RNA-binding protein 34 n=1 Tax=Tanacetum coccineum TaxID=301880 RepID=A0ABQ4WXM5_9ASTR
MELENERNIDVDFEVHPPPQQPAPPQPVPHPNPFKLSHALSANPTPSKQKESSSSKPAVGGNLSYQGIRATKSGGEKKFATRIAKHVRTESRKHGEEKIHDGFCFVLLVPSAKLDAVMVQYSWFQSFAFLMAADKGKRKRPDCESDEISVSRPFKLVSCKTNRGDEENSTDHTKGGYFEEEYDQEGWFIGYRYRGDKAGYVLKDGSLDISTKVTIFSDSNPFKAKPNTLQKLLSLDIDSPKKTNNTHISESSILQTKRKKSQKDDSDDDKTVKKPKGGDGFLVKNDKDVNLVKKERKRDEVEAEYEERKYGGVDVDKGEDEGVKVKIGEKRKGKGDEELLVAKEGFDDEEKLLRTVFVGNLPLKVKKKALLREFAKFGEVESVRIRSIPLLDDKTPRKGAIIKKQINDAVDRVNAYIVFKTEDSAQASLAHNMAVVGGNHIHVDRACPPRKKLKGENAPLYDSKRTVFIGNLPFDVKDEELYQLFSSFNNLKDCIEAIRVVRDPGTSMGKGIAYVLFTTREAANTVVRKHKLKIRDRELRLSHALKANPTPSKQKESSSSKPAVAGNLSYQGIRATKSGGEKKFATRIAKHVRTESRSENAVKKKVRSEKRPSVAARKAAANAARTGGDGGSGSGGIKLHDGFCFVLLVPSAKLDAVMVQSGWLSIFSLKFVMAADKGKRKRLDCEFDEISVSRPFKYHKGGYFEEEYDQEGWFIGYRYRGDKAGYVCREDTDDEVDEEVSSGRLAQYGDGDGENSSEHEGANYEEEYCAEGWFIGYKYKGDKAGYVGREDTNEADYSDEESSNGDFVKKEVNQDYTEDKAVYCDKVGSSDTPQSNSRNNENFICMIYQEAQVFV